VKIDRRDSRRPASDESGGCGCRTAGGPAPTAGGWLLLALLGLPGLLWRDRG